MGITVLSCFDGMSCGQIALERSGIAVDNYYASEIDKSAIKITQKNYPKTIQLGSITEWKNWDIPKPDLIIGGSPCQGFSIAGDRLEFNDERSKLFLDFAEILRHYKPKYFLLENVIMSQQSNDVISSMLGDIYPECVEQNELFRTGRLEPIMINSALVSAQNRERLYWTNIPNVEQPWDRMIYLKDIIEDKPGDRVMVQGCADRNQVTKRGIEQQLNIRRDFKANCVVPTYPNKLNGVALLQKIGRADVKGHDYNKRVYGMEGKSPCVPAAHETPKISQDGITWRKLTPLECERLQTVKEGYTEGVSNSKRYHMLGNGWTVDVIAHIFKNLPVQWKV